MIREPDHTHMKDTTKSKNSSRVFQAIDSYSHLTHKEKAQPLPFSGSSPALCSSPIGEIFSKGKWKRWRFPKEEEKLVIGCLIVFHLARLFLHRRVFWGSPLAWWWIQLKLPCFSTAIESHTSFFPFPLRGSPEELSEAIEGSQP